MKKIFGIILLTMSISALGCGGDAGAGANKKPVFPTTGTVTLFGAPLTDATVAFAPTADKQPTAIGKTDASGKFNLTTYEFGDGAAEGSFKVVVSKSMNMGATNTDGGDDGHGASEEVASSGGSHSAAGGGAAEGAGMVPPTYGSSESTPLTAEVKSTGENNFTFDIK